MKKPAAWRREVWNEVKKKRRKEEVKDEEEEEEDEEHDAKKVPKKDHGSGN